MGSKKLTEYTEEEITVTIGVEEGGFSSTDGPTLEEFIRDKICESDAILVGRISEKESQLTAEEDFIFTDYTIVIKTILKDDGHESLARRGTVTVSRAGGRIKLDDRVLTVVDRSEKSLSIGDEYLLFLKRVSKTGAYTALKGSSSIPESPSKLRKLTESRIGELPSGADQTSVIDLIERNVNSYKCVSNLKESNE